MSIWSNIVQAFTPPDLDRLQALCEIVDRTMRSYADAGAALAEIRDKQHYRATHKSFEAFCQERWNMTPQHAGRIIAAAELARKIAPTGSPPKTERLARPILSLPEDDQVAAWHEAQELAGEEQPRPSHVAAAVAKRKPPKAAKKKPKPVRYRVPGGIVIVEPGRGFQSQEQTLLEALAQVRSKMAA